MDVWENDLALAFGLTDQPWDFRLGLTPTYPVRLPAAWESHHPDKISDGPAVYTRTVTLSPDWTGRSVRLDADAISHHVTVLVNGQVAGEHTGAWAAFQVDLTPHLRPGANLLALEVWKPGGRFPLREALAGFLPDVCTSFGGVWQALRLLAFAEAAFTSVRVHAHVSGQVRVAGAFTLLGESGPVEVEVGLAAPRAGSRLAAAAAVSGNAFAAELDVPAPALWPEEVELYQLTLTLRAAGRTLAQTTRRFGFRALTALSDQTQLNGRPVHLRGVLDWGWDPVEIAPRWPAGPAAAFAAARALGFNLWKCCLYVPPDAFFAAADRLGQPVWLEMPLWLPRVTPALKALALSEYAAVFRQLHHHPAIVALSLGCELNAEADADFLCALHALARAWFPDSLVCDNSGSAEAYGGVEAALADFYDYHFYTDPHFFAPLVQHFARAGRPRKPWLYGEFCDADTLRDFDAVGAAWWLTTPTALDRDDFRYQREHRQRLAAAGVEDGGRALTARARRQATAVRQFILETVRREHATGGYVVTGWSDTPITTSGVVDDAGALKFDPVEWRRFNADVVLCLDRERRRRWVGGDRPNPKDPFTWWQGERAEVRLSVSNGGPAWAASELRWELRTAEGALLAADTAAVAEVPAGTVTELARAAFTAPGGPRPVELELRAQLGDAAANTWRLWAVPRPHLPERIALPTGLLFRHPFAAFARQTQFLDAAGADDDLPLVADALDEGVLARVRAGARALVWLRQPDSRFTVSVPFWREAIHTFAPDPLWEVVPPAGASPDYHADLRFFGVATDFAIDLRQLEGIVPAVDVRTVWRRFDARQMLWAEYVGALRLGRGQVWLTTLRLDGGLGAQPVGFETNPWGAWLLGALLERLRGA